MSRQNPPPPPERRRLNAKIWRACAGTSVQIPVVGSRVYYFPQGHMDQASSLPQNLSPLLLRRPYIPCLINSVQFHADPNTDEVFAKLLLQPVSEFPADSPRLPSPDDGEKIVAFAKTLTASDANNGGGFSVPRYCADSVFPPLNFQVDRPAQNLQITDVHGVTWEFRHIYRGTPRRHLLTTGWSKFVNAKKLVSGDSVVFIKNSRGQIFVGIRRAVRFALVEGSKWLSQYAGTKRSAEGEQQRVVKVKDGFSRDGKGKLSPKEVAEAAELAAQNMAFEVVYYPKVGWSDFVVKAEAVEEAFTVGWDVGMRVKMAVETDDSSRVSWFQGTVSAISVPADNSQWPGSPWRMLQITWDEPEVMKNAKWVSPWQVEFISTTPALHSSFSTTKRLRAAQYPGVLTDGEGHHFPMTGSTSSTMGRLIPGFSSYGTFPAGMQGARHNLFSASAFSNFPSDRSHLCMSNFGNNTVPMLQMVSTDLHVGSSHSENLSPESQGSLRSFGTDCVGNHNDNSTKPGSFSFQLFGAVIQTEKPVENGLDGTGSPGDDNRKGNDGGKACNETEGIDKPGDNSLFYS